MAKTLSEALAERRNRQNQFKPSPFYSSEGDYLSICLSPDQYYSERIDKELTVYRSVKSGNIVGCKIEGCGALTKTISERAS